MKYRHHGYRDSENRDERENRRPAPRQDLTREERIQRRSLRHAIDREAREVVRCHVCGQTDQSGGPISFDTKCQHCRADLHCCRTCMHFDTSARWQCREKVAEAVTDKNKPNQCSLYRPRLVLDSTGRRTNNSKSNDPRAQFESLFKR